MRRRTLTIGAVLLGGAALLLFCCAGRDERSASAPPATADAHAAVDPARAATPAGETPALTVPAGASGTASARPPPTGPGARIASAVQTSDPRDLELLANIERELKRDPPSEVHALIAARKRGATRAELASSIAALPDLGLRVLAFRWLDTVLPGGADAGAR
jgi:hypothetical protein